MLVLSPFNESDFDLLISWIDNEELLTAIAGRDFSFPLTNVQLRRYLEQENSYSFTVIDTVQNKKIAHAEIVLSSKDIFKIDKLIIGDKSIRGKGIGQAIINELLEYAFTKLEAQIVELNVFDWNTAGIRCYEKCGFVMNHHKKTSFQVGEKSWIALNMKIRKHRWTTGKAADNKSIAASGAGR